MPTSSNRVAHQTKKVAKDLQKLGGAAKHDARQKAGHLRGTVSEYYEEGRDKLLEAKRGATQRIREMPVLSVLIAAGAGILCGVLWAIRRR